MRISYWTEIAAEALRETFDAAQRRWPYVMAIFVASAIALGTIIRIAGRGYWRSDATAIVALIVAAAVLFAALFLWKLISIPPRRDRAQLKEISRLTSGP